MSYEQAHEAFIEKHLASRNGERRGRLERGHRHAEEMFLQNVWWPLRGDFNDLHPEYEVLDWRGRSYFADYAFLPGPIKLLFEIKGYAAHVRDMDRLKYCNELNRETFLYGMGYQVISFAYDDVEQRPELCITLLRVVLSRYLIVDAPHGKLLFAEKEIMRLVVRQAGTVRPKDVAEYFALDPKTVRLMLMKLCEKGWLTPVTRGIGVKNVEYKLARDVLYCWD
ncbi:type IV toxin-antitoxin system AbiEi family antitoxin domain-containing protein [Paenibacillus sp. B2(2019)]|uniref:type IV toxin-antitoxin system AbiEi family antitoxin domain-containing protein n=1 Tax=Paenibacillus sp. B2(2019) TaxID=2607754 RepID=UPI0011F26463|nr:type IV toxin-antitoxin system AbiEi family antitoxin domain-containing protein [Paenibacillus sp. B2(2019)]KAA1185318.1 BlaI/MecI/CopY family transcriptional regulator [Paenibacillus sp. B2(2019)]